MNRALVLGLIFLCSFFAIPSMASPETHAVQIPPFVCQAWVPTDYGFIGLEANFTNEMQTNMTVDIFFVWYNLADQVVNIGWQFNATVAARQNFTAFNVLMEPGVFNVAAFVRDLRGDALSLECFGQVTVP